MPLQAWDTDKQMRKGIGGMAKGLQRESERHPFRSMGFVSVIIVSVLFTLGLSLVLL